MMQAAPIRAALTGSDQCRAEGYTVRATAPILAMCRHLVEAGHDPARPLHCCRNDVLALSVSSIGIGAQFRVRGNGVGFEITPTATRPTAPLAHATAPVTAVTIHPIKRSSRKGTRQEPRQGCLGLDTAPPGEFPAQVTAPPGWKFIFLKCAR
jgi:hypothetical protein